MHNIKKPWKCVTDRYLLTNKEYVNFFVEEAKRQEYMPDKIVEEKIVEENNFSARKISDDPVWVLSRKLNSLSYLNSLSSEPPYKPQPYEPHFTLKALNSLKNGEDVSSETLNEFFLINEIMESLTQVLIGTMIHTDDLDKLAKLSIEKGCLGGLEVSFKELEKWRLQYIENPLHNFGLSDFGTLGFHRLESHLYHSGGSFSIMGRYLISRPELLARLGYIPSPTKEEYEKLKNILSEGYKKEVDLMLDVFQDYGYFGCAASQWKLDFIAMANFCENTQNGIPNFFERFLKMRVQTNEQGEPIWGEEITHQELKKILSHKN